MRLTDFGVAQRGAVAPLPAGASAAGDPSASTNRAKLIVLIAVGAGMLLALAAVARVALLRRRVGAVQPRRSQINGGRFPAGRDHFRVYGDRMRVTLDERGADVLVLGLGLAAAVAIGALLAG